MRSFFLLTIALSLAFARNIKDSKLGGNMPKEIRMKLPENAEMPEMDTRSDMSKMKNLENEEGQKKMDKRSYYSHYYSFYYKTKFGQGHFDYNECANMEYTADDLYNQLAKDIPSSLNKALMVESVQNRINKLRESIGDGLNCEESCKCITGSSSGKCYLTYNYGSIKYYLTKMDGTREMKYLNGSLKQYQCYCYKFDSLKVLADAFYNGEEFCINKRMMTTPMPEGGEGESDGMMGGMMDGDSDDDADDDADDDSDGDTNMPDNSGNVSDMPDDSNMPDNSANVSDMPDDSNMPAGGMNSTAPTMMMDDDDSDDSDDSDMPDVAQ